MNPADTADQRSRGGPTPPNRPSDLTRLVALMAAHRDSVATAHGRPVPLAQQDIDRIVARLSAEPRRRGQH